MGLSSDRNLPQNLILNEMEAIEPPIPELHATERPTREMLALELQEKHAYQPPMTE